jgi:hypothetical protein
VYSLLYDDNDSHQTNSRSGIGMIVLDSTSTLCLKNCDRNVGTCVQVIATFSLIFLNQLSKQRKIIMLTPTTTTTGFSLSPGGLLLPYHLGVLDALQYNNVVKSNVPIAGSSAGAIATACAACQLDSRQVLEATIDISDRCAELGGARGRLLPLLREKMNELIQPNDFNNLQQRKGATIIAYRELFPRNIAIHQKEYQNRDDLFNAVCHSSMFPFFATNWPAALDTSSGRIPRIVVDGFFAVPRERFGCPDFALANVPVNRTVSICVFPTEMTKISNNNDDNNNCIICPQYEGQEQLSRLFQLATESSSRKDLTEVYESGWADAEQWCRLESEMMQYPELVIDNNILN